MTAGFVCTSYFQYPGFDFRRIVKLSFYLLSYKFTTTANLNLVPNSMNNQSELIHIYVHFMCQMLLIPMYFDSLLNLIEWDSNRNGV